MDRSRADEANEQYDIQLDTLSRLQVTRFEKQSKLVSGVVNYPIFIVKTNNSYFRQLKFCNTII